MVSPEGRTLRQPRHHAPLNSSCDGELPISVSEALIAATARTLQGAEYSAYPTVHNLSTITVSMFSLHSPFRSAQLRLSLMTTTLLETISSKPYEECQKEWREFLGLLRLKVVYVSAVQTILKEGRWRNKPNPLAYIRKGSIWCTQRSER